MEYSILTATSLFGTQTNQYQWCPFQTIDTLWGLHRYLTPPRYAGDLKSHNTSFTGQQAPVYEIADYYNSTQSQDLLVRNIPLGAALAAKFSAQNSTNPDPDFLAVLMSKHGFTTCATSIEVAVMQAIYAQVNAVVQSSALLLRNAYLGSKAKGLTELAYLTSQEAVDSWETNAGTVERPWDMWVHEVEASGLYTNVLDPNQTVAAAPNYNS